MISEEIQLENTEAYRYDNSVVIYWQNEDHPLYLSKQDVEKLLSLFEGDEQ